MSVTVYGASDDLIEIGGELSEEFGAYDSGDSETRYVALSDGSLLSVRYDDDGCWRVCVLATGAGTATSKTEGVPDGDYTDRVTLTNAGGFTWALMGTDRVVRS